MLSWQEELEELQAVVDAEREKFSQHRKTVQRQVTTKVTEVGSMLTSRLIFSVVQYLNSQNQHERSMWQLARRVDR